MIQGKDLIELGMRIESEGFNDELFPISKETLRYCNEFISLINIYEEALIKEGMEYEDIYSLFNRNG